jgi:hypothetical protein
MKLNFLLLLFEEVKNVNNNISSGNSHINNDVLRVIIFLCYKLLFFTVYRKDY